MRKTLLEFAQFTLNRAQARFLTVMAAESWLLWSRGTGKTVGGTAPWVLHKVEVMPGSCGACVGQSFADLDSKILKPLFDAFQKMGHTIDLHYTYGKEPPKSWKRPISPIIDWKRVIAFPNGTVIQLVSLHQKGSANSNSFQWVFGPEAKYFKQEQLQTEVFPTLRGNAEHFGDSPWYGAKMFETDKYGANIHWLLKKRELHDEKKVSTVLYYQLEVNKLRKRMSEVDESQAYKIRKKIDGITAVLNALRKDLVFVSEAKASDNIRNLTPGFLANMKRSLSDYEYRVSIDNEDPTKVENGFYPDRTENNLYYSGDHSDDDVTQPIAVAMDWQASLTPLVSCQINQLVVPGIRTLNFLQSMHVKHPMGIPDVIKDFCNYHKHRLCKTVILFYDHTAVAERNNAKSYFKEAESAFIKNGWVVKPIYLGQAPFHELKYTKVNNHLRGEGMYPIRMHMERCKSLLLSMDNTGVKPGTFKKDKSEETNKAFPQELAPHFSDAFDVLIWGICEQNKYPMYSGSSDSGMFLGVGIPGR